MTRHLLPGPQSLKNRGPHRPFQERSHPTQIPSNQWRYSKNVTEYKYLGTITDSKLTFNADIALINKICQQTMYFLRKQTPGGEFPCFKILLWLLRGEFTNIRLPRMTWWIECHQAEHSESRRRTQQHGHWRRSEQCRRPVQTGDREEGTADISVTRPLPKSLLQCVISRRCFQLRPGRSRHSFIPSCIPFLNE